MNFIKRTSITAKHMYKHKTFGGGASEEVKDEAHEQEEFVIRSPKHINDLWHESVKQHMKAGQKIDIREGGYTYKLAEQEANAVAPTPVQKQSPAEMKFSPAQERVGPDLCAVVKGMAPERRGFPHDVFVKR